MFRFPALVFLIFFLLLPGICPGREAGWAPLETYKPNLKSGLTQTPKHRKPAIIAEKRQGDTVYDRQPPVTEAELADFIALLPQFRGWARQNREEARPIVNAAGKPDFSYSQKAAGWIAERGFSPARFFCVMGRMAAGVVIIEEGGALSADRPRDMPTVDEREIALVRRHLGELLTAASSN